MPFIPALPPLSLICWANGFVGQSLAQSLSFAVSVTTVIDARSYVRTVALPTFAVDPEEVVAGEVFGDGDDSDDGVGFGVGLGLGVGVGDGEGLGDS